MVVLFIYVVIVICCGIIADNKNRSVVSWVVLGIIFGIFALIPLICLRRLHHDWLD